MVEEGINYNKLVEAKGLYKADKLIGIIGLYADNAVVVCFRGKCYVTEKNQKKIYYIAQSWYSDLIPGLQIEKFNFENKERITMEEEEKKVLGTWEREEFKDVVVRSIAIGVMAGIMSLTINWISKLQQKKRK